MVAVQINHLNLQLMPAQTACANQARPYQKLEDGDA